MDKVEKRILIEEKAANSAVKMDGEWQGWWGCPWCDLVNNSMFFLVQHMIHTHGEELQAVVE